MRAPAWTLFAALSFGVLAGCDALVGGACADGYEERDGGCMPLPASSDGGNASAGGDEGFRPGEGGAGAGGVVSITAPNGAGTAGSCDEPLSACPGAGCVDLESDISNCGACGVHCPTELCVDGSCVGEPVGHIIAIGMSFEESGASSRRVLGNAVFRTMHQPISIVELNEFASSAARAGVAAAVAAEAGVRHRDYKTVTVDALEMNAALAIGTHDVLLIHDQAMAPSGALAQLGAQLQDAIGAFVEGGGTVVALASDSGNGEMCELLGAAGLLSCTGLVDRSGGTVDNELPTDTIGNGVLGPFLARQATAAFVFGPGPKQQAAVVFSSDGEPVVLHDVTSF